MTIYFVQSGKDGPIKIGHTESDINLRISWLQTGNPETLRLLGTMPGGLDLENELQMKFARSRIRGEWFKCSDGLLQFIQAEVHKSRGKQIFHAEGEVDRLPASSHMTVTEVSYKLKIHEETVRRWIRTGRLTAHKTGPHSWSSYLIPIEAVKALLSDVEVKA